MHVLELEKVQLGISEKDKDVMELKTPEKIYFLKAENKGIFDFWKEKIQAQLILVKQNEAFSDFDTKISSIERIFFDKMSELTFRSFEGIKNLLQSQLLREWFFEYITSISPEESGILLLMEFYIKFHNELKSKNFKESFKNINRIYEILKKVSEDWKNKKLSPEKEPEEQKSQRNYIRRHTKPNILVNFDVQSINIEEQPQKAMFHTRNNTPSMIYKTPNKTKNTPIKGILSKNDLPLHRHSKNQFNVKVEFTREIKARKSREFKPKNFNSTGKKDDQIPKIEESIERELIFHDEFFLKIFEKKFDFMSKIFLLEGIESQIVDIFEDLFMNLEKYLEKNYYFSYIESSFYLKKLLFFQNERLKKETGFQKPSFLNRPTTKIPLSIKKAINLTENQENLGVLKKKKVVAAMQLQEIRDFKYGGENPYTMFQEPERGSVTLELVRRRLTYDRKEPTKEDI